MKPADPVAAIGHPFNTTSAPKTIPTVCSLCGGKGCGHCVGSGPKIIYPGTSVIAPDCSMVSNAANVQEKCGATNPLSNLLRCEKPKGHDGPHVAYGAGGTYGWGGTK